MGPDLVPVRCDRCTSGDGSSLLAGWAGAVVIAGKGAEGRILNGVVRRPRALDGPVNMTLVDEQ